MNHIEPRKPNYPHCPHTLNTRGLMYIEKHTHVPHRTHTTTAKVPLWSIQVHARRRGPNAPRLTTAQPTPTAHEENARYYPESRCPRPVTMHETCSPLYHLHPTAQLQYATSRPALRDALGPQSGRLNGYCRCGYWLYAW